MTSRSRSATKRGNSKRKVNCHPTAGGFSSLIQEASQQQQNLTIDKCSRSSMFSSSSQLSSSHHHHGGSTPNSSSSRAGRKRMMVTADTDEGNNSQTAGSTASAISALSSNVDIDSMRPVVAPRTKRRKTGILDAFNSISLVGSNKKSSTTLNRNDMTESSTLSGSSSFGRKYSIPADQADYDDDADSSKAVAEAENVENSGDCYSSTGSSLGDDSNYIDDDMMNLASGENFSGSDSGDVDSHEDNHLLLSDAELLVKKQERKVMLELVFGPSSEFIPQKDPVDVKIKQIIRKSIVDSGLPPSSTFNTTTQSQDDMTYDYYAASSSTPNDSESKLLSSTLPRQNSLPGISISSPPQLSIVNMQDVDVD